jgi:hypothetical protein
MSGKGAKGLSGKGAKGAKGLTGDKKKPISRSLKAGLQFPVGRIHRFLKARSCGLCLALELTARAPVARRAGRPRGRHRRRVQRRHPGCARGAVGANGGRWAAATKRARQPTAHATARAA